MCLGSLYGPEVGALASAAISNRKAQPMLVTEILGNINDLPENERAELTVDSVPLGNLELVKRVQRTETESGKEIGLRLTNEVRELKGGDILYRDGNNVIAVKVKPSDVLVIRARSIYEMAVTAHSLGNRHLQAQFFDEDSQFGQPVMVVQYDHTVEQYLDHAQVPYTREDAVMPEAFRHAEHTH